ncbi:MAG: ATP-dependent helicase HrpB, partial [Planctomycetaceae bacterium]|nr:ATP-dependent helicase HrpB [Planctomycetaceae bacterium]
MPALVDAQFEIFQLNPTFMPVPLPIDDVLPELVAALRSNNCAVLKADAGAGKTTRVPLALLRAGFTSEQTSHVGSPLGDQQIVMLEPRRIAARTSARRIASETGEQVGQTIGYRVRFDEAVSASTRVLIVTEGILLRRLQDDPFLEDIGVVVFDEFHERRLDSDLALAMVRRVQQTVRPDLRIVVMSATMDPGPVSHWLGNCPVIESRGRTFPVRVEYLRRTDRIPLPTLAAQGVEHVLAQTDGDILVFLPGVGEIMKTQRELDSLARRHNIAIMPLYGDLSSEEQDQVLARNVRRKIVLATNVAETSITIDGITAVVDSGYARQMHFDADVGLDRLEKRPVSKASADQRAGRAGRTRPGVCLRLWDESAHRTRADYDQAELHRVDLSAAVLRLHAWGEKNVALFPWFESPPETALRHADRLLRLLGAMDDNGVTAHGQAMVRFPTSPRIARLLIETQNHGLGRRGALLAALLTERDPFVAGNGPVAGKTPAARSQSDVLDRLLAFESFQQTGNPVTSFGTIHRANARTIQLVARQFERVQKDSECGSDEFRNQADEWILRSLVAAFPDRIAKRREPGSDRGLMTGGRGVRFGSQSSVRQCELFLCVDIDGRGTDALIRKASEVRREWLPSSLIRTVD